MISPESFSRIPIFKMLSPADFYVLVKLWRPRLLSKGEVLFQKGDSGDSMFLIEEGVIEITVPGGDKQKQEIRVSVLHGGEFFGELSLIDGLPRTATARAVEASQLLEMRRVDFLNFLMERPAIAISMVSEIGKRLRSTNELVTSLASKNVNQEMEERLSFGDRLADKLAEFGGSWTFIIAFSVFLIIWMLLNTIQLGFHPFDEYPFIFLNLILSCIAAVQAPLIMMSQNRAQKKDRLRAELDYQVNLKSELMLQQLHSKLDEVRALELHQIHSALNVELTVLRQKVQEMERMDAGNFQADHS